MTNGSDGRQQLTAAAVALAADGTGNVLDSASSDAAVPGCLATWFSVDNAAAPVVPVTLAGGDSVTGSATVTLTDPGANQDACQGVSPKLNISAV